MPADSSKIDIRYVAHLARLHLTDDEQTRFAEQLKNILAYVDKLNEVDVSKVEPTAHAIPRTNVWRADEARPSLDREPVLANAPEQARDLFIVPKVIE